jgi:hypothetical protein
MDRAVQRVKKLAVAGETVYLPYASRVAKGHAQIFADIEKFAGVDSREDLERGEPLTQDSLARAARQSIAADNHPLAQTGEESSDDSDTSWTKPSPEPCTRCRGYVCGGSFDVCGFFSDDSE